MGNAFCIKQKKTERGDPCKQSQKGTERKKKKAISTDRETSIQSLPPLPGQDKIRHMSYNMSGKRHRENYSPPRLSRGSRSRLSCQGSGSQLSRAGTGSWRSRSRSRRTSHSGSDGDGKSEIQDEVRPLDLQGTYNLSVLLHFLFHL